nr:DUF916 and DUF3324 domain-containing protein [Neobacillus sp. Marseille-Q6967]
MKFKNVILIMISTLLFLIVNVSSVLANEETVGYTVRALIPDNQVDRSHTYFDLRMKPNQRQEIRVEIFNSSREEIEVDVHITNPITNRNGLIDYTQVEAVPDESVPLPISEIATLNEKRVSIPAGGSKIVPIQLQMPEKEYDGIILGGIYFEKVIDKDKQEDQGVQISNKYAYVIGLQLSETDTEVEPDLQLKSVRPDLVNYRTAIIATIKNNAPLIADNLVINAKVYNEKGKEIKKINVQDYRIAPHTTMDFVIDWSNRELEPGTYSVSLHANSGLQNWDWEEEFVIQEEKAKALNEEAVEIKKDYTLQIISGLSIIILVLIGVIIYLIRKSKRNTAE